MNYDIAIKALDPISTPNDLNQQNKENTVSLNEWRELGPDEVIQEGDERIEHPHGLVWRKAEASIGTLARKWSTLKFRTRRPLPNQEEIPLENELKDLYEIAKSNLARFTENAIAEKTANSIRYLLQQINTIRDEIQKLKSATK